jgi:hypothetical protein
MPAKDDNGSDPTASPTTVNNKRIKLGHYRTYNCKQPADTLNNNMYSRSKER